MTSIHTMIYGSLRILVIGLLLAGGCASYRQRPLTPEAVDRALTVPSAQLIDQRATRLHNPLLRPVTINLHKGLSPDEAAVLAVLINPALRAQRDRQALSRAQLLQAGLLPNPQLDLSVDPVTGGATMGTQTGYGIGLSWDITSLITRDAKVAAARAQLASVRLDVAWQEWQTAQAARQAVYDLVALRDQLALSQTVARQLADNVAVVQRAVNRHQETILRLSAARTASEQAYAALLALQRDVRHQELLLNRALGLAPETTVTLKQRIALPDALLLPPIQQLITHMEQRRFDLIALRRGYESQEQTVRAAILAQFPKINIGFHQASDTTNVHTSGVGVTIDLPIFDRNQGIIAQERATRAQLFDEYVNRVFESRSALATAMADIQSITRQIAAARKVLPTLEQLVHTYQLALEQGNADILSYYQARSDLAQAQTDLIKLQRELMDNGIALELAAGAYLPQTGQAASPARLSGPSPTSKPRADPQTAPTPGSEATP